MNAIATRLQVYPVSPTSVIASVKETNAFNRAAALRRKCRRKALSSVFHSQHRVASCYNARSRTGRMVATRSKCKHTKNLAQPPAHTET